MVKLILVLYGSLVATTVFAVQQTFTIENVGASNNSGTVFINTVEPAANTSCANAYQFKLPLTDPLANKVYSAALMAHASGRTIQIYYESTNCVGSGVEIAVIIVN